MSDNLLERVQILCHAHIICVNSRPKSVFKDQEAVKCLSSLHDKYVIVPADKASNNIVFVCKSYYFECLIKELGINSNTSSNTTYKPTSFDKDEILDLFKHSLW